MSLATSILTLAPVALCSAWTVLGTIATATVLGRRVHDHGGLPPISVLKPLAGADPDLERNLESFFCQDHPDFELVFGVASETDPAIAIVERLRARYPDVRAQVVVHQQGRGVNPKVRNLLGIIDRAAFDLVCVSDSNVVAPAHYLREAATIFAAEQAGIVTHLFTGDGEDGLGAALESVQLAGFCAAGAALPTLAGDALVVGKSMVLSRATLDELGGLARFADVLAEDWLLGKTFQHAGLPIVIAPTVLKNVTRRTTITTFMERQLRWAMIRSRLRPMAQVLEVVTSPLAMLPFALASFGVAIALAWCVALLALRDVGGWLMTRGTSRLWIPLLLAPLRELSMLVVWAQAPFRRHIRWRGHRVRLGMGTYGFYVNATRTPRSSSARRRAVARPIRRRPESTRRSSSRPTIPPVRPS